MVSGGVEAQSGQSFGAESMVETEGSAWKSSPLTIDACLCWCLTDVLSI